MSSFVKLIKRDKLSFVLFCFIYVLIIFFAYGIQNIKDDDFTSYIVFHKFLFYLSAFLITWSHFKCFLTNPGIIKHEFNPHAIEFYMNIREHALIRGIAFTDKIGKKAFEHIPDNINSDEDTDYDEYDYPAVTSIQDNLIEKLKKDHKVNIKRCNRCYVVRFPGVKHCSRCQGCIINMDHHCPWIFNCIGQFNQKFFLQFIGYSLVGVIEVCILSIYYVFVKDKKL